MRDLSARSDVALGTIYRFYSSKTRAGRGRSSSGSKTSRARSPGARPLVRPPRSHGGHPAPGGPRHGAEAQRSARAVITALAASDPKVIRVPAGGGHAMARIQDAPSPRLRRRHPAPASRMLGGSGYAALVGWVNGWSGIGKVGDELELAARLLNRAQRGVGGRLLRSWEAGPTGRPLPAPACRRGRRRGASRTGHSLGRSGRQRLALEAFRSLRRVHGRVDRRGRRGRRPCPGRRPAPTRSRASPASL